MTLRLGYKASAEQFAPRELVELAVAAEGHGVEFVATSDHFQPWRREGGHAPFALAWAAAVAERTSTVSIGTSVTTPTFRYHPAVVAQAVATLGCLAPGRVWLGVGTGEALNEIAAGIEQWPPFAERFARLREAVDLIRALWTEDRVTFEGAHYRVTDAAIYDRPPEPIPILVAAGGPRVAAYAGAVGDGVISTSGKGRDLYAQKLMPAYERGAREAGRTAGVRMIELKVSYDEDLDRAREDTRFWAPLALSAEQKSGQSSPDAIQAAADALPLEQIASRWIVGDDPEEVVARIAEYVELGYRDLLFHAPGADQRRFLRLFERDLAPRLRAL
ncbi:MAG: glucose-6-phosphate dehydrogenase (coenzyme-F420) [Microbacterium sp.]|uniref:glucose-6-phosphate dehydrogenase (coenzyme-F420) n=1 Tax=Microbacterium sp. TaxID=51671 RepID=UPI0019C9A0FF|nr:glucose-6-phosphate dehydrogenase (coenzyme-F420) [Microbacterium sp.]MBD3757618.1 glucose-6-phosphate dehydrogenase (coenzyme-F420) [Microbacterium sp.]